MDEKIPVGVSSCLLGNRVRYDAGHKHDRYVTEVLGRYFEYVPLCPEVAIGLGTPRPPIRLEGDPAAPRARGVKDASVDVTDALAAYAEEVGDVVRHLRGYILKRASPSCGMERVKIYGRGGMPSKTGSGIYARRLMDAFPLLPFEEEGRLRDPVLRENFVTRVFVYDAWQRLVTEGLTPAALVAFHSRHKFLLLSHSETHYREAGKLVATAGAAPLDALAGRYVAVLMEGLQRKATRRRHANVLTHIMGYLKRDIEKGDKAELLDLIEAYRTGRVPLVVPLTLLKHHFRRCPNPYIAMQTYLEPHPEALMLRNEI